MLRSLLACRAKASLPIRRRRTLQIVSTFFEGWPIMLPRWTAVTPLWLPNCRNRKLPTISLTNQLIHAIAAGRLPPERQVKVQLLPRFKRSPAD